MLDRRDGLGGLRGRAVSARLVGVAAAELAERLEIDEEDAMRRGLRRPYGFILPPWPVPEMRVSMYVRDREYYKTQC